MEIKGPTGSIPVDPEPVQVEPGTASRESRNTQSAPSQSVQLKLTPNLFKPGQVLNVIVARLEQNSLLLMLQDRITDAEGNPLNIQLRAARTPAAEVGQRLQVVVEDIKQQVPVLKVLNTQRPAIVLADLLAQAQTRQQPTQQLLNNLVQIKSTEALLATLPKNVTDKIETLWRALPEASQLQRPDGLRQAVQYSGPFLEAHLLKAQQAGNRFFPAMDTRTHLLRLAEALRQQNTPLGTPETKSPQQAMPPQPASASLARDNLTGQPTKTAVPGMDMQVETKSQAPVPKVDPNIPTPPSRQAQTLSNMTTNQILELLTQQTEGSLQRTLTQQLHMLNTDAQRQQLVFELPIRHGEDVDVFDMRIHPDQEGQQQQAGDHARPWTIMMAFNLEGLGPIRAQVSLIKEKISSHWWAEQQQTVDLFQQHMATLQDRLSHVGLDIDKIHCQCGMPRLANTQAAPEQQTHYSDINLDEKA